MKTVNRDMGIYYHHTEQTRRKLSESLRRTWAKKRAEGLKPTPIEVKRKISIGNIGKHNGPRNAMYGHIHSKETKQKISEAIYGRRHSQETKLRMSKAIRKLWAEKKKGMRAEAEAEIKGK
jgi:hypothetical protein